MLLVVVAVQQYLEVDIQQDQMEDMVVVDKVLYIFRQLMHHRQVRKTLVVVAEGHKIMHLDLKVLKVLMVVLVSFSSHILHKYSKNRKWA
jgi:hypothetical protein